MKKLYEEENIRAIAEKIREKTGSDNTYNTSEMPDGVEEVYSTGYNDGYGDASDVELVLYGTYLLSPTAPNYTKPTKNIGYEFESYSNVYGYFYDAYYDKFVYDKIEKFWFNVHGNIYLYRSGYDEDQTLAFVQKDGQWRAEFEGEYYDFPDERYRVIDFRTPVTVTPEVYNLFMSIVDNSDTTPYSIGANSGGSSGDDSFLNELMEWDLVVNSSVTDVYIFNRHPTKYLITDVVFTIEHPNGDEETEEFSLTIPPYEYDTVEIWNTSGQLNYMDFKKVRFSEDGT